MKNFCIMISLSLIACVFNLGCSNTLPVVAQQSSLPALTFGGSLSQSVNVTDINATQSLDVTCDGDYSRIELSLGNAQTWQNVSFYTQGSQSYDCQIGETIQIVFDLKKFGFSTTSALIQSQKFYLRGASKSGVSIESEVKFNYAPETMLSILSGVDGSQIVQFGNVTYKSSSDLVVVLSNSGTTDVQNISVSLTTGTQYSVQANTCSNLLTTGETCDLTLRMTPLSVATLTDFVNVHYQNSSGQTFALSLGLNGNGIAKVLTLDKVASNYSNWNSYFLTSNVSSSCVGTESGVYGDLCTHGGMARKITTLETSCSGLTATDSLGVFSWSCDDSNSAAMFTISGFNVGKGLRDLIDWQSTPTWKIPVVSIQKSSVVTYTTSSVAQWTNAFVKLSATTSQITAGTANAIYYSDANIDVGGIAITANRVAIVTKAGTSISMSSSAVDNCELTGLSTDDGILDHICLVHSDNKFLWIEASLDANDIADTVVALMNTSVSRIHKTTLAGNNTAVDAAFVGLGIETNLFSDFNITDYKKYGIYLDSISTDNANKSSYNTFISSSVEDTNMADEGIYLTANTSHNDLTDVTLTATTTVDNGTSNTIPP